MRLRATVLPVAVMLSLAAAAAPAADPQAIQSTSDVDPGAVRYFDPGGKRLLGRIEESLPFDVQFYLRIPVDDTVLRMSGRYVGNPDPLICSEAFPRSELYVDYGFGPRQVSRTERRQVHPITFTRFVTVAAGGDVPAGDYAELNVVRGLLPRRYYCFEFTRVRKPVVDPAQFRSDLAGAVHKVLLGQDRALGDEEHIPDEVYDQIRLDAIAAVKSLMQPNERLIVPSGSILDDQAPVGSLPPEITRSYDAALSEQIKRPDTLKALRDDIGNAADRLEAVARNRALQVLATAVAKGDGVPQRLQLVLRGREAAVRSAAGLKTKSQRSGIASGRLALAEPVAADAPSGDGGAGEAAAGGGEQDEVAGEGGAAADGARKNKGAKPLDQLWFPEQVAVLEANLRQTAESLRDLQALALAFGGNQELLKELREQGGGGEDLATALAELDTEVKDTLEALFGDDQELGGVAYFVDELSTLLRRREQALLQMVARITSEIVDKLLVEGSTTANYEVRASWYTGMDLGVAWSEGVEDFFSYVGANFYFRPVNKKAPLRWSDFRSGQIRSELLKRLSLTVGVVINDLERDCRIGAAPVTPGGTASDCRLFQGVSQENVTQGLVADKPLVVGGGVRINDFFKISLGALVFKEANPDPLLGENRLAWSPLISISIDWNVRGVLRNRLSQQPFPANEQTTEAPAVKKAKAQ